MTLSERLQAARPTDIGVAGPTPVDMARAFRSVRADPLTFLGRVQQEYGDLVAFPVDGLDLAGAAVHDPVAALAFCTPSRVRHSVINGQPVVTDGHFLPLELPPLVAEHNRLARLLANGGH